MRSRRVHLPRVPRRYTEGTFCTQSAAVRVPPDVRLLASVVKNWVSVVRLRTQPRWVFRASEVECNARAVAEATPRIRRKAGSS